MVLADPARCAEVRSLYEEVRGPLGRALLAWSGSTEVAEDSLSEAFTQLLRRGDGVRNPRGWVWQAAFRIAAGDLHARRRAPLELTGELDLATWGTDWSEAVDLLRALDVLTDQQRKCVALVFIADLPATEAAHILGTSAATVRVQLMRARRRLRNTLTKEEQDEE